MDIYLVAFIKENKIKEILKITTDLDGAKDSFLNKVQLKLGVSKTMEILTHFYKKDIKELIVSSDKETIQISKFKIKENIQDDHRKSRHKKMDEDYYMAISG